MVKHMSKLKNDVKNLTGKILLATPAISNEYLSRSMVLVCSQDDNGAMGLIINKPMPNMNIRKLITKLNWGDVGGLDNFNVYFGGLEETDRCFVLHSDECMSEESAIIRDGVALTINSDIIRASVSGGWYQSPREKMICIGCCMWDADQLENEVASSYWIPVESDEALIFGNPRADKWSKALLKIGVHTNLFSRESGNA